MFKTGYLVRLVTDDLGDTTGVFDGPFCGSLSCDGATCGYWVFTQCPVCEEIERLPFSPDEVEEIEK